MNEQRYDVYFEFQCLATNMSLDTALILVKAAAEAHHEDVAAGAEISIRAAENKVKKMKYSKPLMTITELVRECGYSRTDLYRAVHHDLADKYIVPTAGNGKFRFDTAAWEKYRPSVLRTK